VGSNALPSKSLHIVIADTTTKNRRPPLSFDLRPIAATPAYHYWLNYVLCARCNVCFEDSHDFALTMTIIDTALTQGHEGVTIDLNDPMGRPTAKIGFYVSDPSPVFSCDTNEQEVCDYIGHIARDLFPLFCGSKYVDRSARKLWGYWRDKNTGVLYVDRNNYVYARWDAFTLAERNKQLAIYNIHDSKVESV
jgi:hypothetical protein